MRNLLNVNFQTVDTNFVNWDRSEPSDVGSYILKSRLTICSSNFFAKILSKTYKTPLWINVVQFHVNIWKDIKVQELELYDDMYESSFDTEKPLIHELISLYNFFFWNIVN